MKTVNIVLRKYGIYDYIWTHKDFNIESELIRSIGVQVSEEKIKEDLNSKYPWWRRLFWTRKRKALEKAKVVLRELTGYGVG